MTNTLSSCYRLCDVGGFPFASSPRLCFSLFLLLIGNPISNKNKNDELGEEAKGKPPTTQNTQSHSSCKVHLGGLLELVKIAQGFLAMCPRHESINRAAHDEHSFFLLSAL